MIEVVKAKYLKGYQINVFFNDGKSGIVDLKNDLWGEVFAPLKDVKKFKNFKLEIDTIAWDNGADFAPEFLYKKLQDDGDELVEIESTDWWKQNKHMVLAGARHKINMTQKELAARSGIRQAVISEYEGGKRPITLKAAIKLAAALNTTPDHLMP